MGIPGRESYGWTVSTQIKFAKEKEKENLYFRLWRWIYVWKHMDKKSDWHGSWWVDFVAIVKLDGTRERKTRTLMEMVWVTTLRLPPRYRRLDIFLLYAYLMKLLERNRNGWIFPKEWKINSWRAANFGYVQIEDSRLALLEWEKFSDKNIRQWKWQ